ncbi:hypothetical protein ACFO0N_07705 [Halobium salinum]|uniref:Right handed beta helix domain-containing protein n=1 Tax=Halobium salinum TaxID=1364940 RepID=A0ABD5PBK3_9EURY|nr:hypothetical protein [Halobium salinum]
MRRRRLLALLGAGVAGCAGRSPPRGEISNRETTAAPNGSRADRPSDGASADSGAAGDDDTERVDTAESGGANRADVDPGYAYPLPDVLDAFPSVGVRSVVDPESLVDADESWPVGPRDPGEGVVVDTATDLVVALRSARPGDVVRLPADLTLDLTGYEGLGVPPGVTLASGGPVEPDGSSLAGEPGESDGSGEPSESGGSGGAGARIVVEDDPAPLFRLDDGSRLTGLRVEGPRTSFGPYSWRREGTGVAVVGDGVEVDRCVLRGWGHAGVEIGRDGPVSGAHVHGCDLVDNLMTDLGYGAALFHGEALFQHNYLDDNRHGVACSGYADAGYEARYNVFGPRTVLQSVDMHSGDESGRRGGSQAGRYLDVHHNVFRATRRVTTGEPQTAVFVRGRPVEGARVVDNWFAHEASPTGVGAPGDAFYFSVPDLRAADVAVDGNRFGGRRPPNALTTPA